MLPNQPHYERGFFEALFTAVRSEPLFLHFAKQDGDFRQVGTPETVATMSTISARV